MLQERLGNSRACADLVGCGSTGKNSPGGGALVELGAARREAQSSVPITAGIRVRLSLSPLSKQSFIKSQV